MSDILLFNKDGKPQVPNRISIMKLGVKSEIVGAPSKCVGELYYEDNLLKFEGDSSAMFAVLMNTIMQQSAIQLKSVVEKVIASQSQELGVQYIQVDEAQYHKEVAEQKAASKNEKETPNG